MAGLYEIWRDPTRDEDDPDRFRWTCTVLTTEAEDALGHIHDRMPLMVEPPTAGRSGSTRPSTARTTCSRCSCRPRPGGSRRSRSPRWSTTSATTAPSCSSRSRLEDVTGERRCREPIVRRRTATPGWSPTGPGSPLATLLLSHGAGGGIDTPDLDALAAHLPRQGITVLRLEQPWRVAGRKVATAARRRWTRRCAAAADGMRTAHAAGGRRPLRRRAVGCPLARDARGRRLPGAGVPAAPARAAGEVPARRAARRRVPTLVVQGERDPFGRPEEFPDDVDLGVVPGADHCDQGAQAGRR